MEPLPVVLVALLVLYMVPFAFGLECYAIACTNWPDISGGTKCESGKAENITCDPLLYNRCMTANYTMSIGQLGSTSFELRNCSHSLSCDPDSQWNTCKLLNVTGMLTDCSLGCCQGDLCNKGPVPDTTPNPKPASLECYACTNKPEIYGGAKCESGKAEKITCDPLIYNRCMTTKYTMSLGVLLGPRSFELRNCSNSIVCDPDSQWNTCKLVNSTGKLTDCSLDCCEGDLCNKVPNTTSKPEPAGLECYTCSNQPELLGGTKCESGKAEKITCDPLLYNRCMTLKYTAFYEKLGSMSFELRNCTDSASCDLDSEFYMCKMDNSTGTFTDCSLDCCEGNLCNKIPEPTTKRQDQPTSEAFELVASFGAILFVFVLNMFA